MITVTDKKNCCGCQSCANICPKQCITMRADGEGFLYPHVDTQTCVNCGLCEKVCPILHKPQTFPVINTLAAKHKDPETKLKSSSGGVFTSLAQAVLKEGGVVFGAAFDAQWNIVHTFIEHTNDLDKLRRSKYVQSDMGKTYAQAKTFLDNERFVFFTGTPCQIAGLRNFLGKPYENLLTADIICHAVPSPSVWQQFLHENFDVGVVKAINFRDKTTSWTYFYLSFLTSNGLTAHGRKKTLWERLPVKWRGASAAMVFRNLFLLGFLRELINRPSCHACRFKGLNDRLSDFTLGDLWGNWPQVISAPDKKYGVSAVLINSAKGQAFFERIKTDLIFQPVDAQQVALCNTALETPTNPHPKRAEFFARRQKEKLSRLIPALLGQKPLPVRLFSAVYHRLRRRK